VTGVQTCALPISRSRLKISDRSLKKSRRPVGKLPVRHKFLQLARTRANAWFTFVIPTARRLSSWNGREIKRLAREVFVNDAGFHDANHTAHRSDVFERIAVERDDVGFVARRN